MKLFLFLSEVALAEPLCVLDRAAKAIENFVEKWREKSVLLHNFKLMEKLAERPKFSAQKNTFNNQQWVARNGSSEIW